MCLRYNIYYNISLVYILYIIFSMKKNIIDTYTTIYYVDIVVANKYTTLDQLKKLFTYSDGDELDERINNGNCTTSTCVRKSDNRDCILIKYNKDSKIRGMNKALDLINTVCHESGHAVLDIYDHMDQHVCNCTPEPFCYLLGYIAECVYKTLTKK